MQASSASTSIQPQGTYARCSPTTRLTPLLPKVCFLLTAQVPARRPAPQRPPLAPLPKVNSRLPKPGLPRPARPAPVQGKPVWDLQSRVRLLHCPSPRRPLASRLLCALPPPGGHGDTRLAAGRQEADLSRPDQSPPAQSSCRMPQGPTWRTELARSRGRPAKGASLAPG